MGALLPSSRMPFPAAPSPPEERPQWTGLCAGPGGLRPPPQVVRTGSWREGRRERERHKAPAAALPYLLPAALAAPALPALPYPPAFPRAGRGKAGRQQRWKEPAGGSALPCPGAALSSAQLSPERRLPAGSAKKMLRGCFKLPEKR